MFLPCRGVSSFSHPIEPATCTSCSVHVTAASLLCHQLCISYQLTADSPLGSSHTSLLHFAPTRRTQNTRVFATVGLYQTWTQFCDAAAAVTTHSYEIHLGILPFEMMFRGAVGMWGNWRVCCLLEASLLLTSSLGS